MIEVESLAKTYTVARHHRGALGALRNLVETRRELVHAVAGVSFDIRKGEIRAIIGPNGAGKTSLLNIINGFYQPQRGRITFKGRPRAAMRPYEAALGGIARTFQYVALFKGMTSLDNIMAGRTLKMRRGLFP